MGDGFLVEDGRIRVDARTRMIIFRAGGTPCTRSGQTIGDSMPILSEVSTVRVLVRDNFHKSQR
ncbi:hypothetical protein ACHMW5_00245 (plasmid) [Azospirillum melinis]|uniref:hypothetical protein n=1 Tax=Azospirillum TaxID=191 RepID=UPI0011B7D111|nr:hypothetical protein [Azospirillum sp. TSA6c]